MGTNARSHPTVAVPLAVDANALEVAVADDGPGIAPAKREPVFDPSERGLDSDGEGVGLFLTRSIVEQYGVSVVAEPDEPRGTVVRLRLPRSRAVGQTPAAPVEGTR